MLKISINRFTSVMFLKFKSQTTKPTTKFISQFFQALTLQSTTTSNDTIKKKIDNRPGSKELPHESHYQRPLTHPDTPSPTKGGASPADGAAPPDRSDASAPHGPPFSSQSRSGFVLGRTFRASKPFCAHTRHSTVYR